MANVLIFVGGITPLPSSRRPTGMYKSPVTRAIELGLEGFDGDCQADRRVHGGPDKAVHLYPARHYASLATAFPEAADCLLPGAIGENLSTRDIDEGDVRIGDVWALGEAQIQVCQPRNPCWKIDERFSSEGMAAHIAGSLLTGWYFRVVRPGRVSTDNRLELLQTDDRAPTLRQAMILCQAHRPAPGELEELARTPGIASAWRSKLDQRASWLRKHANY